MTIDFEFVAAVRDVTDGFRDVELDVARLAAVGCVEAMRDPRLGTVIEEERGASLPGPGPGATLVRFCVVLIGGFPVGEGKADLPTIMLDRFVAILCLLTLRFVAPVTVPLRFRPVLDLGAFSFPLRVDASGPIMLSLARLFAVCLTIMLAGRGLPADGAGLALNSRRFAASSSSRLRRASRSDLRFAAIDSPGREKVGWVGAFDDFGGGAGGGNWTDMGRRRDAK